MKTRASNPALVFLFIAATQTAAQTPSPPPAATPLTAATNAVGPKIRFEAPVHDFGKIVAGETVKCDFVFTNAGDALLEIRGVGTSCGCTTAGDWPRQIEPGKTGKIPIQFHSGNFGGQVTKIVTVNSNDKEQPSVALQIKGTIWKPVDVNPQFAVMYANPETIGNAKTTVRIVNNEDQPLALSTPESNNRLFVSELKTNQPGKEFELLIGTAPSADMGNLQGVITLKTSSTNAPVLNITAMAVMQPVLTVMPPQINLPTAPLPDKVTYSVSIRYSGTNVVALSEPAVNAKDVTAELKELEPGRAFSVALSFPAGFEIAPGQTAELSVKSNHPQFPVIKVPITQPPRPVAAASPGKPAPVPHRSPAMTAAACQPAALPPALPGARRQLAKPIENQSSDPNAMQCVGKSAELSQHY